jgi:hypothetical protein
MDVGLANKILATLGINSSTGSIGPAASLLTITAPIRLHLIAGGTMSDATAGTELTTSGGYTSGYPSGGAALNFGTAGTPTPGSISTNQGVSWSSMPTTSLTGCEQWDSSATAVRIFWAPWSTGSISVASGNTFTVASGNLTNTLT